MRYVKAIRFCSPNVSFSLLFLGHCFSLTPFVVLTNIVSVLSRKWSLRFRFRLFIMNVCCQPNLNVANPEIRCNVLTLGRSRGEHCLKFEQSRVPCLRHCCSKKIGLTQTTEARLHPILYLSKYTF